VPASRCWTHLEVALGTALGLMAPGQLPGACSVSEGKRCRPAGMSPPSWPWWCWWRACSGRVRPVDRGHLDHPWVVVANLLDLQSAEWLSFLVAFGSMVPTRGRWCPISPTADPKATTEGEHPATVQSSTWTSTSRAWELGRPWAVAVHVDMDVDNHPPWRPTSREEASARPRPRLRVVVELADDRRARGRHLSPPWSRRPPRSWSTRGPPQRGHGIGPPGRAAPPRAHPTNPKLPFLPASPGRDSFAPAAGQGPLVAVATLLPCPTTP
jgi:hypothetical protein